MKLFALLTFILSMNIQAICVHEKVMSGLEIDQIGEEYQAYIKDSEGKYKKLNSYFGAGLYDVQIVHEKVAPEDYDDHYIEYYRYKRIQDYLVSISEKLERRGYETSIIGKSLEGRNLYAVKPINFDPNKKTIVMFGRHHGDEGTANWIIEGFVNNFFSQDDFFHSQYQILLYPMINPDGAENMTRYNKNGLDLNRQWSVRLDESKDESKIINTDLRPYLAFKKNIPIVLDMHGSFTNDFIYRVKKNFLGTKFFKMQQTFIDLLGQYDIWQNGSYQLSNGHPRMARIVIIKNFNLNALTHETPKNIKLNNSNGRTKQDLIEQGRNLFKTVSELY